MTKALLYLILLFNTYILLGQCPPDNFTLHRQGQIDSFSILYPGCNDISGVLTIYSPNIKNLTGLNVLERISGRLRIYDTELTSLSGLSSLDQIYQLELLLNAKLESLAGIQVDSMNYLGITGAIEINLNALASIQFIEKLYIKGVPIQDLYGLASLDYSMLELIGLPVLGSLEGLPTHSHGTDRRVKVDYCASFLSTEGIQSSGVTHLELWNNGNLQNISSVGTNVDLKSLMVIKNPRIVSISGLENLSRLETLILANNQNLEILDGPDLVTDMKSLNLTNNPKLFEINGFDSVRTIQDIHVTKTALTTLDFLQSIDSVPAYFMISENPFLADLEDVDGVKHVGTMIVEKNPILHSLHGLDSITEVIGHLILNGNPNLSSLYGLESLQRVDGYIRLHGPDLLQNLQGLQSLKTIGAEFWLYSSNLKSMEGLESLDSIYGSLHIAYCLSLTDFSTIHDIQFIDYNFLLNNLPALTSIPDFVNLSAIGGYMYIADNANLQSVEGFHALTKINGMLQVSRNQLLTSLSGLDNIQTNMISELIIEDNTSLSLCNTPAICQYLEEGSPAEISGNATGCLSGNEVLSQCGTLASDDLVARHLTIYPNPAKNEIYFNSEAGIITKATLMDARGIRLKHICDQVDGMDLKDYLPGVYFLQMHVDDNMVMRKVIKL